MIKIIITFLLILSSVSIFSQEKNKQNYPCDLNKSYDINIPNLKFKNCEYATEDAQNIVCANYVLETKYHYQVEKHLREKYKMGKIVQFQWGFEVENHQLGLIKSFMNKNGELLALQVSMFGEMKEEIDPITKQNSYVNDRNEVPYYVISIILSKNP